MSQPWPPPPDLPSLKELVAAADIEGFITDGSPADEYDTEAEDLFTHLKDLPTADLTPTRIAPILQSIWQQNFSLAPADLAARQPALQILASEISHFFGPEAQPLVRS